MPPTTVMLSLHLLSSRLQQRRVSKSFYWQAVTAASSESTPGWPSESQRRDAGFTQVRLGVAAGPGILVSDSDHHDANLRVCAPWPLKPPAQAVTGLNAAQALAGPGPGPGTVTLRCRRCRGRGGLHWQFTGKTQSL